MKARAGDSQPQALRVTVLGEEKLPQIPALTGIRFFAAFFILFAHSVDWLVPFPDKNLRTYFTFVAMYGMPLFFVLSGFVIHYNYRRLFGSRGVARATCEFAAARFARLFPLYIFLLLMAIFAEDFLRKSYPVEGLFAEVLAYDVTLTQTWWYAVYEQRLVVNWLFPIAWSISTEMYFYVAYVPAVFLILLLRGLRAAVIAAIACAVATTLMFVASRFYLAEVLALAQRHIPEFIDSAANSENSFYRWCFYFSPYARIFEFFLGCLAVHVFMLVRARPVTARERSLANLGLLVAMLTLAVLGALYVGAIEIGGAGPYVQHLALNFLCAPAIAFVLFYSCRYDTLFTRLLSASILVVLGEMSYSIYLLHPFTIRMFSAPPPPEWDLAWSLNVSFRVLFAIVLTLLLAYATYRLIEVPSRVWLRAKLGRIIAFGFGRAAQLAGRETSEPQRASASTVPGRGKLVFASAWIAALLLVALAGQAARSDQVWGTVHRLWVGDRPEIAVVSASYGLNCRTFSVQAPFVNLAAPGNVTRAVKRACDTRERCEFLVAAGKIGDPVNGCGKDFSVGYRCTGSEALYSSYVPGEADGKRLTLDCTASK